MLSAFRRLTQVLPGAYLLVELDGRIRAANDGAVRLLARPRAELLAGTLADIAAVRAEDVRALLARLARSSSFVPGRLRLRIGQEDTDVRVHGACLHPNGDLPAPVLLLQLEARSDGTDRFIALNRHIADLQQEIARRKRVEDDLAQQREWFQVTLSSIGDAVIATDVQGRVSFMNPVAESLTGWSSDEAVGRDLTEVFPIANEDTLEPVENPVGRVLREGCVVGLANHTVLLRRDGTHVPIDDSAAPIRTAAGELIGVVLVFHDVSEQALLQRELARQTDALIEADRRKNEFLAMLAHELRNPLAPLRTAADVLQSGRADPASIARIGAMMQRQVGLLTRMVDDLLDVARITRGKIEMRRGEVVVQEVVERAVEAVRPVMDQLGHALHVSLPEQPVSLVADASRLAQAFSNILLNAAKFTPRGGRVTLEAHADAREVAVRITDNGVGMTPGVLASAFELFAQGEPSLHRGQEGLGIGLTLVRTIVHLHGGRVQAHSDGPGKGSTFTITLPRNP